MGLNQCKKASTHMNRDLVRGGTLMNKNRSIMVCVYIMLPCDVVPTHKMGGDPAALDEIRLACKPFSDLISLWMALTLPEYGNINPGLNILNFSPTLIHI